MPPLDPQLDAHFDEAARLNNLDPMLLRALAMGESSGNAGATSPQGAGGLMQIMPDTAKKHNIADPYDPVQAIYGGAKILGEGLTNAEKLKQSGRTDINPVDYALRTYFGGEEGPQWGQKTAAYPGYIASKYQALTAPQQPGQSSPIAVQPLNNAAMPPGIAQLAAAGGGQASGTDNPALLAPTDPRYQQWVKSQVAAGNMPPTAGTLTPRFSSDSPIPPAIAQLAQTGNRQPAQAAPAIPSDEELLRGLQEVGPLMRSPAAPGGAAAMPSPGGQPMATGAAAATIPGAMPPGVAALAQAGAPQQINPEFIAEAQRRANMNAALGRQTPGYLNDAAALPFVAPKEAAQQSQKIEITRDGGIYIGGVYVGHAPKQTTVTDAQGNEYPAFTPPMGAVAPGMRDSLPGGASTPGAPSIPNSAGFTPPPGAVMAVPSKLGPGLHESLTARAKEEQDVRQKTIDSGSTAQMQQAVLSRMQADAPNMYTGPFANHVQQFQSIMRLLPGGDKLADTVASYEDFQKNAGQLVRTAVHDTSPRAAVQEFKLIGGALPNPEMSPVGLRRVLNEYMGLNDYHIAKTQAQQGWEQQHGGIGNVSGFETDWQGKVSPYAFMVARMDPADRQTLFSKAAATDGGQAELKHLGEQIQFITQSGLDRFLR